VRIMNGSRLGSVDDACTGLLLFRGQTATDGVQSMLIIFGVRVSLGYNVVQPDCDGFQ